MATLTPSAHSLVVFWSLPNSQLKWPRKILGNVPLARPHNERSIEESAVYI